MTGLAVVVSGLLLGFGKAGVAGTLGPFVTVLIVLAVPADDAVGLLLPMLIVADGFSLAAHWRGWEGAMVVRLLLAATVGIAAGSAVISTIDERTLRKVIAAATGLFVVGCGALRRIELPARRIDRLGIVAGATAGFTSTLAHLGGPPGRGVFDVDTSATPPFGSNERGILCGRSTSSRCRATPSPDSSTEN